MIRNHRALPYERSMNHRQFLDELDSLIENAKDFVLDDLCEAEEHVHDLSALLRIRQDYVNTYPEAEAGGGPAVDVLELHNANDHLGDHVWIEVRVGDRRVSLRIDEKDMNDPSRVYIYAAREPERGLTQSWKSVLL